MFKKAKVNNLIYKDFGDRWYNSTDCFALLRNEAQIRNAWVLKKLNALNLDAQHSILDLGCGAGFLSNKLAKNNFNVTGVDLYDDPLAVARSHDVTGKTIYIQANALNLPFENESFDVICMMDFLEHIEGIPTLLKECSRVLKKNGFIFFHTFNRNWISWFIAIKCVEWFIKGTPKHLHVYNLFIKPQELISSFEKLGLQKKELTGLAPVLTAKSIYDVVIKGEINDDFTFKITPSLCIGYMGYVGFPSS